MPSTADWRSAVSRADASSPRKPASSSLLTGRVEHLRDAARYQPDPARGRSDSTNSTEYTLRSRTNSHYTDMTPLSPGSSIAGTPMSVSGLVHPIGLDRPSTATSEHTVGNDSPPATTRKQITRPPALITDPSRQEKAVYSSKTEQATAKSTKSLSDSAVELNEIKQSVERLRAQRTHVEQLGQQNERLKAQLATQEAHNNRLRDELARVQNLSQENVGLLQTVKLLEERARTLESLCHEKRSELRRVNEKLASVDHERQQLLLTMESIEQDHAETIKGYVDEQTRLRERLTQLERKNDTFASREREWTDKLTRVKQDHEVETEHLVEERHKLRSSVAELEEQVQKLLATTVRQTTIIEDCDRALSEAKRQHANALNGYDDQRRVVAELTAHTKQLETQLAAAERSLSEEKIRSEKIVFEVESKLSKRRDKIETLRETLKQRDQQLQDAQREQLLRDRNRYHSDEANKELKKREQILQSEISELRIALQDVADEKALLKDHVLELQERLQAEQKDRQRWATARLQLLAEFCDEENKLTSVLQGTSPTHRHRKKEARQEEYAVWSHELESSNGSDNHDEQRRGSIIFG